MEQNVLKNGRGIAAAGLAAAICLTAWQGLAATNTPWIKGVTDKDPLTYRCGEKIVFTLTLERADALPSGLDIVWTRTGDDGRQETGKVPADPSKPLKVETTLDRPGFVRLYAILRDSNGKVWAPKGVKVKNERAGGFVGAVFFDGGAGVDVEAIRQGVAEPADFDAFWARHKATLAAVPMTDVKCTELPSRNPKVKIFIVSVPCAGPKPATGYLLVPTATGKYPAEITFHGYGASWSARATQAPDGTHAKGNRLTLALSAHGFELNREPAYYQAERKKVMSNGHGHAFDPVQNADPEKAYFCGMTYRVMRGLEYLKSRPEWNGRDLIVSGGSQGGLQSIWGAALVPGVTEANIYIPWCCDMGGTSVGRNHGTWYIEWVPALGYYDPVNMARRIPKTCRVNVTRAGLGDYTCPPTGVAAFYNNLTCPKTIKWVQGSTHSHMPPSSEKYERRTAD